MKKSTMLIIILIIFAVFLFWTFKIDKHYPRNIDLKHKPDYFGVTFSRKFARELGLNWREAYIDILDDLEVKYVRLPIYWDDIEPGRGVFIFDDYDYMIEEGTKRGVKFIINVGWRLPRWPECHSPRWVDINDNRDIQDERLVMIEKVAERYKDNENIIYWQVENEPFLDVFGECPKTDKAFLIKEVELVKKITGKEVIISASGELSNWKKEAEIGDILGSTLYRVVWGNWVGYLKYPIPSWFYRFKANLIGVDPSNVIITELQAEPWVPKGTLVDHDFKEGDKSLSIDQFKANIQYAINVDFKQTYLWGVEWWYWEHKNGNSDFWNIAKQILKD